MTDSSDFPPAEAPTRRSMRDAGKPSKSAAPSTGPDPQAARAAKAGGLSAVIAAHPRAWLASILSVVFLLLGTAAVFAGAATGSGATAVAPAPTESALPPRPQPTTVPAASRVRSCSIAALAADPRLATLSGSVVNASTGEILFDHNGAAPLRSGDALQVLTAAAALTVLGPDAQLSTKVIDGSSPGTIVLVGGGDPTLATTPQSFYGGAPQISALASTAKAAYTRAHPGVPITTIVLDATMWNPSDSWDQSWLRKEQSNGYQPVVTALMINGGREQPSQRVSPRSNDPIGDAGRAFADAAGLSGVSFSAGTAVGTTVLGEVKSQPLGTLIDQMLQASDGALAETLARVVSKTMGFDGSSGSVGRAISGALAVYGLPTNVLAIRDGSGLSDLNGVPPQFLAQFMVKLRANEKNLGLIYASLPVSGRSGVLAGRFTGANAAAAGAVVAKTGTLDTEYSLAGVVTSADGTALGFAFYAIRDGITSDAKQALDTLVTGLFTCGDNLSNN